MLCHDTKSACVSVSPVESLWHWPQQPLKTLRHLSEVIALVAHNPEQVTQTGVIVPSVFTQIGDQLGIQACAPIGAYSSTGVALQGVEQRWVRLTILVLDPGVEEEQTQQ